MAKEKKEDIKMNKFAQLLSQSNKDIKGQRAQLLAEDAKDAHEELLRNLRQSKRDLDRKLLALSDLAPDSELSLRVVKKDFSAKLWVEDIQATKIALANKIIEIKLAEETFKEWFYEEA